MNLLHKLKPLINENTLKNIAWFIFLVISCLVIANLFVRMVDNPALKVIFAVIAIGLDLFRQYTVSKAKQYWKINKGRSAALWLVYIAHFSIVIIASAGFTLSEVNLKSQTAGIYNMEKQSIINTINSNEAEIKKLESLRGTLDPSKWQFRQVSDRIDVLQNANSEHYQRLDGFKEVKVNVKEDVFGNIGKVFHVKGESLEIYVFVVMAILIELALLITSKDIKTVSEVNETKPITESKTRTETEPKTEFRGIETQTVTLSKPESREFETRMETLSKPEFREFETRTQTNPVFKKIETQTQTEPKTLLREIKTQTKKNDKKLCPICGKCFPFKRNDKIFCSNKCRSMAYRNKSTVKGVI